jgi:zinc transporter
MHLREEADRVVRYVEDLDSARERAAVTQEELVNRVSEQINSRTYVLSVAAAIFLPLGFLTGLFGINVGGIALAENPSGFST